MTSSYCLYHDARGRLRRQKSPHNLHSGAVTLHVHLGRFMWDPFVNSYMHLSSVSMVFSDVGAYERTTVLALYDIAPKLQRLSVKFEHINSSEFRQTFADMIKPLPQTSIRELCVYGNAHIPGGSVWPRDSLCRLQTLRTDLGWIGELPCHLRTLTWTSFGYVADLLRSPPTAFSQLQDLILQHKIGGIESACDWMHFFTQSSPPPSWLFFQADFLDELDHESAAEDEPQRLGKWLGYRILRKRLSNILLANRHLHRTRLRRILLETADRVSPSIGSSVLDVSTEIFRLLRLV